MKPIGEGIIFQIQYYRHLLCGPGKFYFFVEYNVLFISSINHRKAALT